MNSRGFNTRDSGPLFRGLARPDFSVTLPRMISALKAPGFQARALPLSVAAWHGMIRDGLAPKRAELIRGVIIEKMSKSILHSRISDFLAELFKDALRATHWVRMEAPLTFADSEPEPDVSVVAGHREDFKKHPTAAALVIEVSVSTLADDREMAGIYAEAGIAEYWIVNLPDRCLEVHRQPGREGYAGVTCYRSGQSVTCATLPVTVEVGALFAGLGG